jgi:predicted DNA-binding ribbon-helix-helix protein
MTLIRRSMHLAARQWQELAEAAAERGISIPELVRRIIDEWLQQRTQEREKN